MARKKRKWRLKVPPQSVMTISGSAGNILDCLKEQFPDGVFVGNNSFQAAAMKRVKKLNKKHEARRIRGKDGKRPDKGVDPRDYQ